MSTTVSFDDLWDQIEAVQKRTKDTEKVLDYLYDFFSELQSASSGLVKHIKKISKSEYLPQEPHAVASSIKSIHTQLSSFSDVFANIDTFISSATLSQVSSLRKELQLVSKKSKQDYTSLCKDIASERQKLETLRQSYYQLASSHEKATYEAELARLQLVPDSELSCRIKQALGIEIQESKADEAYRTAVERVRNMEVRNYDIINRILSTHCAIERQASLQSRAWLAQLAELFGPLPALSEATNRHVADQVATINVEQDLADFVKRHDTNSKRPTPITYVPFMKTLGRPSLMNCSTTIPDPSSSDSYTDESPPDGSSGIHSTNVEPQKSRVSYATAQWAYSAADSDETSIEEDEEVILVEGEEGGWIKVRSKAGTGLVPFAYLKID
ncbi:hypothetical protein RCL1_001275 [Eukaryota sp. TZLM3-RCL]